MSESTRIRINLAQREVEIEGSEAFVREYADRFDSLFERLSEAAEAPLPAATQATPMAAAPAPAGATGGTRPLGSLGEFLHELPASATEVDRMLAAGFFLQSQSIDSSFTTADANKRLAEHGIKIGNPSQCVRQSLTAKRVFTHARGRYRVSQSGRQYLRQLMGDIVPPA